MKCRQCNSPRTRVTETRTQEDAIIRRRRDCEDCGHRFTTHELPPEAYSCVRTRVREWSQNRTSPRRLLQRRHSVLKPAAVEDLEAGMTIEQVAAKYKVAKGRASTWSADHYREIRTQFSHDCLGMSNAALAEKYGISQGAAACRRCRINKRKKCDAS